ncbi:MAG: DUF655 domain-containing protein [Chamaesiphon sp.]
MVLTLTLTACQQVESQNSRSTPLPQDPFVQVYFNHEPSAEYKSPYNNQRHLGDNLEEQIINTIGTAKSTVDVAVQELRLPKIARSLVERQKAGVRIRVILESKYNHPWSYLKADRVAKLSLREREHYLEYQKLIDRNSDEQISAEEINEGDALAILRNAGVKVIDNTSGGKADSGLMHHKFVIVDNKTLIVTSANFTSSDIHGKLTMPSSQGNANNLLKIESSELAALFTQEFNLMWGDEQAGQTDSKFGIKKPFRPPQQVTIGDSTITVEFSPISKTQTWSQSSNGLIGKTLSTASHKVDMALFVFSEPRLGNILETDHQHGVQVRTLIEREFAYRPYSEGLSMMGVALWHHCKPQTHQHLWQEPMTTVGVPLLPKGDLLHHKFGVVDGQIVITGSHNWSEAANNRNDETLLVIKSPTVAAHFEREFERLYAHAQLGVPPFLEHKIALQQKRCHHL